MIERVTGTRYLVPLREGGSLPAVVNTDPPGSYVVKFRGAGQGAKALVAEAIAAGLAGALDLPVPKPAVVQLDAGFGKAEPDPEIQDILRGSAGANFGLTYLSGALAFDAGIDTDISADLAASIVWFDALITNVDRTPRNTNLLLWRDRIWMIDHGASLYIHYQWSGWEERIQSTFPQIRDHVLLHRAGDLMAADERLRPRLTDAVLCEVIADVPDEWLGGERLFPTLVEHREAYVTYLQARLNGPRLWLREAIEAQRQGPVRYAPRITHRVV